MQEDRFFFDSLYRYAQTERRKSLKEGKGVGSVFRTHAVFSYPLCPSGWGQRLRQALAGMRIGGGGRSWHGGPRSRSLIDARLGREGPMIHFTLIVPLYELIGLEELYFHFTSPKSGLLKASPSKMVNQSHR